MNVAMDVWALRDIGSVKNQRTGEAKWIRLVIHRQHERPHEQEKQVVDAAAVAVPNVEELDSILHDVAMRHSGLACRLMQLVECTDRAG